MHVEENRRSDEEYFKQKEGGSISEKCRGVGVGG